MKRTPLKAGTKISSTGREYIIDTVIGSGATCIVYSGHYIDNAGVSHDIRVKECYPYNSLVERKGEELIWNTEADKEYSVRTFSEAYEKLMKNQMGNFTVNAFDLINANKTLYIIMDSSDGITFDKENSVSIYDILYTIKLLAYVVGEYHKKGYLHLDIKPENFLVFPRPSEHIILFDMDSITSISDIKERKVKGISYSAHWAAPEQIQGKYNKLCPATDIFSIGAVLFNKVMGRNITGEDSGLFAEWDFEQPIFKRTNPKVKLYLNKIFKNTLAANINRRYQNVNELLADIEIAMEYARFNSPYVVSNYPDAKSVFVGRDIELTEVYKALTDNRVVFLSGIGGIGKTSIALEYLNRNRKEYGSILFMRYEKDIETTLKNARIVFRNYKNESHSGADIIDALSELMDENDLIVIDNFDKLDNINDLNGIIDSSLKCKFLITSRISQAALSDMNYYSEVITEMKLEDITRLFCEHNKINYNEEETIAVKRIFNKVECHTLCVELIAKYLRITDVKPTEFYKNLSESLNGIISFDDVKVTEEKDNEIRRHSMQKHIEILFDITELSDKQKEMLYSLSLLDSVRISKKLFLEWMASESKSDNMESLIELGWIETNDSNKISLHQLISDSAFSHMEKTEYRCDDVYAGIYKYLLNYEFLNSFQHNIIGRVCFLIAQRSTTLPVSKAMVNFVLQYYNCFDSFYCPDNILLIERSEQFFNNIRGQITINEFIELYLQKAKACFYAIGRNPDNNNDTECSSKMIECYNKLRQLGGSNIEKQIEIIDRIMLDEGFSYYCENCNYMLRYSRENTDAALVSNLPNSKKVKACMQLFKVNSTLCSEWNEGGSLTVDEIQKYTKVLLTFKDTITCSEVYKSINYKQIIDALERKGDYKHAAEFYQIAYENGVDVDEYNIYYCLALSYVNSYRYVDAVDFLKKAIQKQAPISCINTFIKKMGNTKFFEQICEFIEETIGVVAGNKDLECCVSAIELCAELTKYSKKKRWKMIKKHALNAMYGSLDILSNSKKSNEIQRIFNGITTCYINTKDIDYYNLAIEFFEKTHRIATGFLSYESSIFLVQYSKEVLFQKKYIDSAELFKRADAVLFNHEKQLEYLGEYFNIVKNTECIESQIILLSKFLECYKIIDWECVCYGGGKEFVIPARNDVGNISSDKILAFAKTVLEKTKQIEIDSLYMSYLYDSISEMYLDSDDEEIERDLYMKQCEYALIAEDRCLNIPLDLQVAEWANAGDSYAASERFREAHHCYSKARELCVIAKKSMADIHVLTEKCMKAGCKLRDAKCVCSEVDNYVFELRKMLNSSVGAKDGEMDLNPCYMLATAGMYESAERLFVIFGKILYDYNRANNTIQLSTDCVANKLVEDLSDIKSQKHKFQDNILHWCEEYINYCEEHNTGNQKIKERCIRILAELANNDFEVK